MSGPVSVASLGSPDKDGFLTKQGGSIKTWKRRWFVLKGSTLYYFKTKQDAEETGRIDLGADSTVADEPKKRKHCFSVTPSLDAKRTFYMVPDRPSETQEWITAITKAIENCKKLGQNAPTGGYSSAGEGKQEGKKEEPRDVRSGNKMAPRVKISNAKEAVPFLQMEDSKVLEFWQIWSESIPPVEELTGGLTIDYHVSTSANMQKLTWRTAGPQNVFIQKMVDFFWNVGAPESEIDRLNDVGALINPVKIGSWIDMSGKGGMDGGWYFPVEIPLKLALDAADPGDPATKLKQWSEKYGVDKCMSVGRDMGAAPPRQTEFRFKLTMAGDFTSQLRVALDAYEIFGFPEIPEQALKVLKNSSPEYLCMSVITSSEGFVRVGLLQPAPDTETVNKLSSIVGASTTISQLNNFEQALGCSSPSFAEYQYLKEGFGYGVYKEGFDIVFHYNVGEEQGDD